MKRFLTRHGMVVLSVATVVAVTLSLVSFFSSNTGVLTNIIQTVSSPFRTAATSVAEWAGGIRDYLTEFDALREENAALKEQIARMEEDLRQAERDSEENATLRRLLDLREQRRELHLESARIIQADTSNWASTLTLNAGDAFGVSVGDCVITETGDLVGVISETGGSWSTCTTVLDTETSIGAQIFRTGDIGVARGDFSLMGRGRLQLDYLDADASPQVGDLVVSSGLGGYYPSHLVIGTVEEVMTGDDGLAQYAVLSPAVDLSALSQVFIITDFSIVE